MSSELPAVVEDKETGKNAVLFKKGGTPGPGRPKGLKNRFTTGARDALQQAFEEMGGVESLVTWGRANKSDFFKLWGKSIPKQVEQDSTGELVVRVRYEGQVTPGEGD